MTLLNIILGIFGTLACGAALLIALVLFVSALISHSQSPN